MVKDPKTARTGGRVQHVAITDPVTVMLCRLAWQEWLTTRHLLPGTTRDLDLWFKWAMLRLGLPTQEYLRGTTVERSMWRGRWEASTTLKRYAQESASILAVASLPGDVMRRVLGGALGVALVALTASWPAMG